MNGSELSKTSLGDAAALFTKDDSALDQRELERWASAIAGCLHQTVPTSAAQLGLPAPSTQHEVTAGWRPCVEAMTPYEMSSSGAVSAPLGRIAAPSSGVEDLQRIQVRVRTEEFGEIALVVERVEAGLRVLLGAQDPHTVSALMRESEAVRRVLESGGQSVGFIKIVRMTELGTDLAQPKLAPSNRTRGNQESVEPDSNLDERKKRTTKRIDLIG